MKTRSLLFFLCSFFSFSSLLAQPYPEGSLYVLNEGKFGDEGSIGMIDFPAGLYTHIDSIAAYGNQIIVEDEVLYAIDGNGDILLYDAIPPFQFINSLQANARGIAFFQDEMLVASTVAPYFRSYDKTSLSLNFSLDITEVRSSREKVVVLNDLAYVSGFFDDSIVYVVDIIGEAVWTSIQTDYNPFALEEINQKMYIGCANYNSNTFSIHKINHLTQQIEHTDTLLGVYGMTASDQYIYAIANQKVIRYDVNTRQVDTTSIEAADLYSLDFDQNSDLLFCSFTDYISTGEISYAYEDTLATSRYSTHISPRAFYFEGNVTFVSVEALKDELGLQIGPNPVQDRLYWTREMNEAAFSLQLMDLQGSLIRSETIEFARQGELDMSDLAAGMYLLQIRYKGRQFGMKILK